ncbi:MAG: hypothetical protein DRG59_02405 [Deltaproteobacteria bacterium]|nr:MAG: hypothetical protein DRG59_02405 [Deltaproteobacteria bacterium]
MKKLGESLAPEEWKQIARKDWQRTKRNLSDHDAEAAGFFLQQSLEKYLKAFLLQQGWKLRKIHELDALLDDAIKYNPDLKSFYELCERVTGYYFAERYPPLSVLELTCEDIEKDLREAESFVQMMFPEEPKNAEE